MFIEFICQWFILDCIKSIYNYIDDTVLQHGSNSLAMVGKDSDNVWKKL